LYLSFIQIAHSLILDSYLIVPPVPQTASPMGFNSLNNYTYSPAFYSLSPSSSNSLMESTGVAMASHAAIPYIATIPHLHCYNPIVPLTSEVEQEQRRFQWITTLTTKAQGHWGAEAQWLGSRFVLEIPLVVVHPIRYGRMNRRLRRRGGMIRFVLPRFLVVLDVLGAFDS